MRTFGIAQEDFRMKRFHVHVGVQNLEQSIAFYSNLFGAEPALRKPDYAKWMLDEPRLNFAISQRDTDNVGVNHLGLQAESAGELGGIRERFDAAGGSSIVDEPGVHCCYAKGDKHWVTDPQGIAWEAFHTLESTPFYNASTGDDATPDACCSPGAAVKQPVSAERRPAQNACCS
jgi:catechol 2,3-dioxygenase-like lactoylglutathione lyase family enzyme